MSMQDQRAPYADVAHDYPMGALDARLRAARDRVMRLKSGESNDPEPALEQQRAEQDLSGLERSRRERIAGIDRLGVVRHGPVRHVANCLVPSPPTAVDSCLELVENQDAGLKPRPELAAKDIVGTYEEARDRDRERVGHLKIGFDTVTQRRCAANQGEATLSGRTPWRTTNEWYKEQQFGDAHWLYVVWDPFEGPDGMLVIMQSPAKQLDYAQKETVAACYYDVPGSVID